MNSIYRTSRTVSAANNSTTSKTISAQTWPTTLEWARREQERASSTFRRLGIESRAIADGKLWASQVLTVLGPDSFAEFSTVRTPGTVIWCNFDLASQLGFAVPQANQMTSEFHEQLLAALSFRAVSDAEDVQSQEIITMYADRYGGDGVRPALGAGRAGFLPYGNLYVKGIGFTPLFKHDDPNDFAHSHGGVHLDDCLSEAVFGEVNENLFTRGSTRILAIIDQGKHVTAPTGRRIPVALVVRTGAQLRPAHLLGSVVRRRGYLLNKFVNIARATDQLVSRPDKETGGHIPDVKATMLRIIDDHARTSAEGFRWRMIHGALSASNMEMSGAMLDLPTQSTQPRTAPIRCLDYADSVFGTEHIERAAKLMTVYRTLSRNTPAPQRDSFNVALINFASEMKAAYRRHLEMQLLSATGLKIEVAQRIQKEMPELAVCFTDLILQMVALKNPGTTCVSRSVVEYVSVVDVFHLLKSLPQEYFANPNADHTEAIREYLKPVFKGNRSVVAEKQATVSTLASEFAVVYGKLMQACANNFAGEYYGDVQSMQTSIIARAAFENEPLDYLYSKSLHKDLNSAIAAYKSTGNAETIREAIDQRIIASLRSVDRLLAQGNSRRLNGGGLELEMRTIGGINYSVKAWDDALHSRRLHVSIPVERKGSRYVSSLPQLPCLTKRQVQSLRYRYATDGWKTFAEVAARLNNDEQHGLVIDFDDLPVYPLIGRLEGTFYLSTMGNRSSGDGQPRYGGYIFAIPDRHELLTTLRLPVERTSAMGVRPQGSPDDSEITTARIA